MRDLGRQESLCGPLQDQMALQYLQEHMYCRQPNMHRSITGVLARLHNNLSIDQAYKKYVDAHALLGAVPLHCGRRAFGQRYSCCAGQLMERRVDAKVGAGLMHHVSMMKEL